MKLIKIVALLLISVLVIGCQQGNQEVRSASGVSIAKAKVKVQANGLTMEQNNIKKRLEFENKPGSIKHLYVISPYSGQVILYSTVKGKVTSSGKRLSPKTSTANNGDLRGRDDATWVNGKWTAEIINDTGTYGSSIPYIYWWDVHGRYHQHFISGGQIVHISNKPISVKSVVINMETSQTNEDDDAKYKDTVEKSTKKVTTKK